MIVLDFALRLSLLVVFFVVSGYINRIWDRRKFANKIAQGILFGLGAIISMKLHYEIFPGVMFDGKTILVSLCTLFFGPISGSISAFIAVIYRVISGGYGTVLGVITLVVSLIVGYFYYRVKERRDIFWLTTTRLFLFGFILHAILSPLLFIIPVYENPKLLANLFLGFCVFYPIISLLYGKILFDQEVSYRYTEDLRQRELLFRTTLYSIGDAVITTDAQGLVQKMNSVAEELTGWKERDAVGRAIDEVFNIVNEFTFEKAENPIKRVLREGTIVGLANHTVLISRDDRKIAVADSGAPIKDEKGNIIGVVLVFRDQTKEREYLRKIEEQEKRYRQFVHFSTDGIWRFDIDEPIDTNLSAEEQIKLIFQGGFLAECNDVYAQMYGFEKKEDIIGIRLIDVMKPDDAENVEYLKAFIENGYKLSGGISKEYDKFGNIKYFENNLVGIIEDGYLVRAWGTQKDITEKVLLENSLRESEEKFRLLSEASLVGIYLIQDNKFAYINKALADVFGYSVDEVIGKLGPLDLTHPDDHPKVIDNIRKRISGEVEAVNYTFRGVRKDGSVVYIEVFGRRIVYQGKPGIIGTLLDITNRVRLEEENRIKTQQLESIIELTPNVAIQLYDIDGRIIYWNNASEKVYGYSKEEALGKTLDQLIWTKREAEDFKNVLKTLLNTRKSYGPFESKFRRKDGSEGWILSTTFAIPTFEKTPVFVCMDIETTARKIAEINLQEQLELFQALVNTIKSAIVIYHEKDILFVNDALIKLTGYSIEELYSMPVWDSVHPDQRDMVVEIVQKRFKGEVVPQNYEIKLLTKDGKVKWVDYSVSMFNYKGQKAALGTGIDITERKLNEEIVKIQYKLADAVVKEKTLYKFFEVVRNELSRVIDTTNLFVAFYEEESDELYSPFEWDEKMDAPLRWTARNSLTGKVVKEGRTLLLKKQDIQELYEKGEIELYGSRAESWLGVPLFVGQKSYGAIVIQSYDNPDAYDEKSVQLLELVASQLSNYIIQKMQTEELTKLSLAIEKSLIGVLITDTNGTIEYVNPKLCEITGYNQDELIGNNPRVLKSGFHTKEFYENLWNKILGGNEWEGEFKNKRKNGELYWDKTLITPIFNEDGKITHFVAIKEDITEQKKLIEELISAKEKALESEKLKTSFLANISHEVRTPLNGLMGFAQILESQSVPPAEIKRFAHVILEKAEELLELFNDILDLSLIETNQIKITPKPTNINKILYDVYSTFSLNEKVKNKLIELRIKHTLPEDFTFITDPLRLKQILNNLVDNALKFTKKGYVEIGARIKEASEVEFYVKDTGIGIPMSMYLSIFEKFQQIDVDFLRKEYQGLGLGLPICKGLVNRLKGRIWVESEIGEGSTFYFTISQLDSEKIIEEKEMKVSLQYSDVGVSEKQLFLVAEDDYINYLALEKFLKKYYECEILHASTGKEAIDMVEKNPGISLVILDIRMPIMDGFTAFQEIKKINPSIPIIALTAYSYLEDRRKIIEYGFDDYISKPFDFNELISKVNKLLSTKRF